MTKRSLLVRTLATSVLGALVACSSGGVSSTHIREGAADVQMGMHYWLPKKIVHVDVYLAPEGRYIGVFNRSSVVPDNRYLMRVNFEHALHTHDDVTVSITENGFLSSVNSTVTDKSSEIVLKLVEVAKSALALGPTFSGPNLDPLSAASLLRSMGGAEAPKPVFVTTYALDPTSEQERAQFHSRYQIDVSLERLADCRVAPRAARPCGTECVRSRPGVCYRPTMPYQLALTPGGHKLDGVGVIEAPGENGSSNALVLLPNEAPIFCIPVRGSSFGEGVTELTFSDGMLTSVHAVKPSELLGFLSIPADVLASVLALPGELLTIRIENNTKVGTIVDSELGRLNALERFASSLAEMQQAARERDEQSQQSLLRALRVTDWNRQPPGVGGGAAAPGGGAVSAPQGGAQLPPTYPGHLDFKSVSPTPSAGDTK